MARVGKGIFMAARACSSTGIAEAASVVSHLLIASAALSSIWLVR